MYRLNREKLQHGENAFYFIGRRSTGPAADISSVREFTFKI